MAQNIELLNQNLTALKDISAGIRKFLTKLLDEYSFVETDVFLSGDNLVYDKAPLGEGVVTGYATIDGNPVYIVAQNAEALNGSFGKAHAEKLLKNINRAIKNGLPLISIIDSTGLRIGEGIAALDGYSKVIAAARRLMQHASHIVVVKGPAVGLMAVYATTSDFIFMASSDGKASEKGNGPSLSLGAPMVISAKATQSKKGSEIVGAQFHATKSGLVAASYKNEKELRASIISVFEYLDGVHIDNKDDPNRVSLNLNKEIKPEALLSAIVDDGKYVELYKEWTSSVRTVLASVNSIPVGIVLTNANGSSPKIGRDGIKKIKKFIDVLSKYKLSLVNLVDCEGIIDNLDAEQSGILSDINDLFLAVIDSDKITKISVVTGSAIGAAYALLVSKSTGYDFVVAFSSAKISAISAEVAAGTLYLNQLNGAKDPIKARIELEEKYKLEESNPFIAAKDGSVDNIIEAGLLRPYIASALTMAQEA
ncbi:MAG: hypothetical protein LBU04_00005 [Christensenellaceae bacterium]|jgi:acetyl-CoA carboxylase carboxyltransferase component|nr:hypothetical protein [Christensenellaceae bacterium]